MRMYYYQEGDKQIGPLKLDQLKGKNITALTPVWYDPLPKWTTAGEVPELKAIYDPQPVVAEPVDKEYYYKEGDKQYGPLSLKKLQGKKISASTPMWYHPLAQWTTAGEIPELKSIIEQAPVIPAQPAIKEYYFKEGDKQYGPLKFDEIKKKTITPDTPVWYHPLPKWVKAEEIEELRPFLIIPAPKSLIKEEIKTEAPIAEMPKASTTEIKEQTKLATQVAETEVMTAAPVKEEVKPIVEKPVTVTSTATVSIASTSAVTTPVKASAPAVKTAPQLTRVRVPSKKGPAWITWTFSSLVLAGAAFFVYQDMEKNKKGSKDLEIISTTTSADNTGTTTDQTDAIKNSTIETPASEPVIAPPVTESSNPSTTTPVTTQTTSPSASPAKKDKKPSTTSVQTATVTRNNEEDKTKTAAAALAAREAEIRNHWQNYISFGRFDYKAHALSGVDPFFIPVINNSDYMLDQVTVWVDYIKKGGGVHKSETIVINNIPPHSTLLGKASGNSRGTSVKTSITAISCKKLHFCYPLNNGTNDPFYCK